MNEFDEFDLDLSGATFLRIRILKLLSLLKDSHHRVFCVDIDMLLVYGKCSIREQAAS